MRHVGYFVALALSSPALAQPVSQAPWMTGAELVRLYSGEGHALILEGRGKFTRDELARFHDQQNEMRADAYMDGVHDQTEGKAWCYSARYYPKPDTLRGEVIWELRKLPKDQLKRNAADLIVEAWSKKWPCGGAR